MKFNEKFPDLGNRSLADHIPQHLIFSTFDVELESEPMVGFDAGLNPFTKINTLDFYGLFMVK
jgi:hypothetical protein